MNPDYIPTEYGVPLAIALWLILFLMILWDRRKLNRALRERPTLKIMNEKGDWKEVDPQALKLQGSPSKIQHRPVSNFYDQEKDLKS